MDTSRPQPQHASPPHRHPPWRRPPRAQTRPRSAIDAAIAATGCGGPAAATRCRARDLVEAAPEAGTLRIEADVPGAQVFIDRQFVGAAPVTAENVKPGPTS